MNLTAPDNAPNSPTVTATQASDPMLSSLQDTADTVIGSVFYGTLLRTLRSSTLKGPYGHGGRGEEVFQTQLDQVLTERAGRARGYDLSDAIVERLADQQLRIQRVQASQQPSQEFSEGAEL
jgi:hypothetical protein